MSLTQLYLVMTDLSTQTGLEIRQVDKNNQTYCRSLGQLTDGPYVERWLADNWASAVTMLVKKSYHLFIPLEQR